MTGSQKNITVPAKFNFKKQSQSKETWRRFKKSKTAMIGLVIFIILLLVTIFADVISPYDRGIEMNLKEKLQPPSSTYWFGTDGYGRDLFSRCIHGGRISLLIGFSTSIASMLVGCFFGSIAGYYGEKTDNIIMRFMDIFSAIPTILLALAIVAALGSSLFNLILALAISRVPGFTRIVRSAVLSIADQEFIEAARAGGTKDSRILIKHILPNCISPIIVQTTMNIALMILQAASMSFLGLGVNPPTPEWGSIISEARQYLRTAAYMMAYPGVCLLLASLSMNLLGDGLRDALDPRLKS